MELKTISFSLRSVPGEPWPRDLGGYSDAASVIPARRG